MIGNRYVDIGAIVVILMAEANMEDVLIMFEYVSSAISMVAISIQYCKPLHTEFIPQISDGECCTVEVTTTSKEVTSSVMISGSSKDKGVVDFLP